MAGDVCVCVCVMGRGLLCDGNGCGMLWWDGDAVWLWCVGARGCGDAVSGGVMR